MKFGYKVFLMSFFIVIIATTSIGVILINNSFKVNIETEINKNIVEIININSTVNFNIQELVYMADNYLINDMETKVTIGNDVVFTNMKGSNNIETMLIRSLDNDIKSLIKDGYLYMAYKDSYTIITKTNIQDVFERKDQEIAFFTKTSIIISLVVAFFLSLIVSLMTRKIKKLKNAVKEIEEGNYDITIPKLGSDEIGDFARSISTMGMAINKNIEEIEKISEARKIFIGNLTHEIRTPLTSIIGYSSLIKNDKVTDLNKIKAYSKKIYEEGEYIEKMRDKLMQILTLDSAKLELKSENISLILKKYLNELKELYPKTTFIDDINDNIIKNIDETLFKSLVFNLVKNGISASSNPLIKITLKEEYLIIEDNGHGIKKEDIEKIKEPFYTTGKDRNRATSGMGLGLTLCCNIIEIHSWHLEIKSKINIGTKMIIYFGGVK